MKFIDVSGEPRRIVGIARDIDDENIVHGPALTVYQPFEQEIGGGRLFVHAKTDPHALVPPIGGIIRELSANQPVERPATLEDVRAEVLAPDRLTALVFGGFAAVALVIRGGRRRPVRSHSRSARGRASSASGGDRICAAPSAGARASGRGAIAAVGVVAGAIGGYALARIVGSYINDVRIPGVIPIAGAAVLLVFAAILASVMPAARASRVDVFQALRAQ